MNPALRAAPRIAGLADIRAIEAAGQQAWMPHSHVYEALAEVARCHPQRLALSALAHAADAAPRRWSYAQLLSSIRQAGRAFRSLLEPAPSAEPGDQAAQRPLPRVALLLPPLPEAHIGLWAAEAVGVAVPLNHALNDEHLLALLKAAQVNLIVSLAPGHGSAHGAADIGTRVLQLAAQCPSVQALLLVGAQGQVPSGTQRQAFGFEAAMAMQSSEEQGFEPHRHAQGLVALFHTGGTTGLPKLGQHTHANQLNAAWGAARLYNASEHDCILNGFPLFHVAGAFVYGLSMLLAGAHVLLPPPAGWRDAAFVAHAWPLMQAQGVSVIAMVPTVMAALLAAPGKEAVKAVLEAGAILPSALPSDRPGGTRLRLALTGGSPLPNELAARFESETGLPVRNILGMTECAGVIAIEPALAPRTPGSCGLPLPFSQVLQDEQGVLRVHGPNVGPGYTEAARNAGTFEAGWLITGDVGHVDDAGRVFVTGRAKDLIIRGAHNIDPGLIEEALLSHPSVAMAAAVGEPDEYAGELPVAYVVAKPGALIDEAALIAYAAPHIAERVALPKRISVVPALPLTAIGKVYKPALRAQAAQRLLFERLASQGLSEQVQVQGEDRAGRVLLRFVAEQPDAVRPQVQALMAGFALGWELVQAI